LAEFVLRNLIQLSSNRFLISLAAGNRIDGSILELSEYMYSTSESESMNCPLVSSLADAIPLLLLPLLSSARALPPSHVTPFE
jgi:hypothetical protein